MKVQETRYVPSVLKNRSTTAPVRSRPAPPGPPSSPGWLLVDFCGEEHDLGEHGRLSFGRAADLVRVMLAKVS